MIEQEITTMTDPHQHPSSREQLREALDYRHPNGQARPSHVVRRELLEDLLVSAPKTVEEIRTEGVRRVRAYIETHLQGDDDLIADARVELTGMTDELADIEKLPLTGPEADLTSLHLLAALMDLTVKEGP